MMIPRLKMSDLKGLSEEEKRKKIRDFLNAPPPSKEEALEDVDARIQVYIDKYQITSDEMERLLKNGDLKETNDICTWLIWIALRNRILQYEESM